MLRVSAILLAAGESTRMGQQKALLLWRDEPLIDYQLRQLTAVEAVSEVIVVTGHEPAGITASAGRSPKARAVHNPAYRTGKVSSILAGLATVDADTEAILLLSVDQPRPAGLVRLVVDSHFDAGALISVATHDGHRGHPVVFHRSLLPELRGITEQSEGIRAVMRRHAGEINDVETGDATVLLDLNTPQEYEEHRARGA